MKKEIAEKVAADKKAAKKRQNFSWKNWKDIINGNIVVYFLTEWLPVILLVLFLWIIYIWNTLDYDQIKSKNRQLEQEKTLLDTKITLMQDTLNRVQTRSKIIETLKSKGITDSKRPPIIVE